ncbi:hypothetical protein [Pseudonocardia sp. HH130630-07]|uniref:hypothetical protein n=1 Tax=Pseudonocardia sp. HH130630-07 TaxID=1690815 RepID=UPI000814DBCE|nr:hypothetical protein [Pseudonocardia sp. HH130630-07]ANY05905.1 hypothetical protein AFB00_05865 [Pseudonocardia sp. HH130630-07]
MAAEIEGDTRRTGAPQATAGQLGGSPAHLSGPSPSGAAVPGTDRRRVSDSPSPAGHQRGRAVAGAAR